MLVAAASTLQLLILLIHADTTGGEHFSNACWFF